MLFRSVIRNHVLEAYFSDTVNAHELRSDGTYVQVRPAAGEEPFDCQNWFICHPLFEPKAKGTLTRAIPSDS